MEKLYKCGYCGFLLSSQCENVFEHECIKEIFVEGLHNVVEDDARVLTVVHVNTGMKVLKARLKELLNPTTADEESSWEEGFIKLVQDRPPLYNFGLPLSERSNAKKMQLWKEISNLYGGKISAEELQKKWKYLRDCYIRAKKKVTQYKQSGSGASLPIDHGFRYFELMKFIDDGMNKLPTICSVPSSQVQCPSPSPSSSSGIASIESPLTSPVEVFSPPSKKKKTEGKNKDMEKAIVELLTEHPIPAPPTPVDGVDGFVSRMAESLRHLPFRKRAEVEITILNLLYEAEFGTQE